MNIEQIEVTVICITYNQEDYIADALESFVSQETDFPFEVLVHDDASTDSTAKIIRSYHDNYPSIIKPIYEAENQFGKGTKIIQSIVMPKAQGRFIAFCEGDDYWTDSRKLQKQYDFLCDNPETVMCVHASRNIASDTKRIISVNRPLETSQYVDYRLMLHAIQSFSTNSFFIRRETLEQYYASEVSALHAHGDHKMSLYCGMVGNVYYYSDIMSNYRVMAKGSINRALLISNNRKSIESNYYNNRLELLNKINNLTSGKYSKDIEIGRSNIRYIYLCGSGQFFALRREFGDRFKSEPIPKKARILLMQIMPRIANILYSKLKLIQLEHG